MAAAAAVNSGGAAPATPWWKSKARMAVGAAVLVAVVLVAVLVPTLSNKPANKAAGGAAAGVVADKSGATVVPASDLTNVVNALLVANTPVSLPADLAEKQAAASANGTATTTVTPVGGSKDAEAPADVSKQLAGLTTRAWPALTNAGGAGANPTICYPKNGSEVVAASKAESKCTVIMLTNGGSKPYDITQQMNITSE